MNSYLNRYIRTEIEKMAFNYSRIAKGQPLTVGRPLMNLQYLK